ncbi:unnamed protein product, partial [Polarella glacialis]
MERLPAGLACSAKSPPVQQQPHCLQQASHQPLRQEQSFTPHSQQEAPAARPTFPPRPATDLVWPESENVLALAYDLETTGSGHEAQIVDFAAVCANIRSDGSQVNLSFQSYVLPDCSIHWAAQRVHGITVESLRESGAEPFAIVFQRLLRWIEESVGAERPIIWAAHNGTSFDHRVLQRCMQRAGFDVPAHWVFWDTLPLARRLLQRLFSECTGGLLVQQGVAVACHARLADLRRRARLLPGLPSLHHSRCTGDRWRGSRKNGSLTSVGIRTQGQHHPGMPNNTTARCRAAERRTSQRGGSSDGGRF